SQTIKCMILTMVTRTSAPVDCYLFGKIPKDYAHLVISTRLILLFGSFLSELLVNSCTIRKRDHLIVLSHFFRGFPKRNSRLFASTIGLFSYISDLTERH